MFGVAVAGAALAGWWYASVSTPHPGPIVLVSVDGLSPSELPADGHAGATPAIDALAADAVVFERAYTHSPLTLPAHASLLAGQLPFEHGVRDDAGFALKENAGSLAERLRNRGFETGAFVSSFLLRPATSVAQGFTFFDAELPDAPGTPSPVVTRDGHQTTDAAARWMQSRSGHRFFLFVQVSGDAAESAVTRLVTTLKDLRLYDQATIVLTASHGGTGAGVSLDDSSLHVPLLVKQPDSEGAGHRVGAPVQHIDILPTVLDLVRAPIPSGLRGRSLRAALGGDETGVADRLIYAESLAGRFRFGGPGKFALARVGYRYVRALALDDGERAEAFGEATEREDPGMAVARFVRGRLLHAEGRYEEALVPFEEAAAVLMQEGRALEELYWYLGETLVRLDRYGEAEAYYHEELQAFPRSIRAYSGLATLYHAADRTSGVEEALDALVDTVPTPEGYDAAARLWTIVGEPARAEARRADARTRFNEDPSLALFQPQR